MENLNTCILISCIFYTKQQEYVEKYPKYSNISPARSLKPKQEYQVHRGKMEGITTFKRPFRVQEDWFNFKGMLLSNKTYMLFLLKFLKFCFCLKDDYRSWEVQRREPSKVDHIYHPPTEKFGNPTTFQDDFAPRELNPRQSYKPPCMARLSDVPFDSTTSHRTSYIAHQLAPKFVKLKEEYRPNNQPFEDLTTHRSDFKGLAGPLAKSCKPEKAKVISNAHFNGVTEFQDHFQPWLVSLPEVRKTKEYIPPPGSMDFNSTSHLDYVKHEISPAVPIRPISNPRITNAPFQGNTTMKEDFKAWDICQQEIIKKQQEIPKPTGKFYDLTTFKSHYIPHQIIPAQSFKPVQVILPNPAHFQDETMYRTEYTPKKQEMCPANYPSPPGYVYVNTDCHGHKFFRQLTPEFCELNSNQIPKEVAVVS
uniref:Stabilizer of axonemal microtubules 2 n=1 Tax=Anser cygnoides TaxID=8845 RepID=A0A8B9DVE8_ANSCY